MPAGSAPQRERQYERVKDSAEKRGASGEARQAGSTSTQDKKSAVRRGGERSHRGPVSPARDQLHEEARKRDIHGRPAMNKQQPAKALGHRPLTSVADPWSGDIVSKKGASHG